MERVYEHLMTSLYRGGTLIIIDLPSNNTVPIMEPRRMKVDYRHIDVADVSGGKPVSGLH